VLHREVAFSDTDQAYRSLLSMCERIGPYLNVYGSGLRSFAHFHQPRRALAVRAPQRTALPAVVGIVDAPVKTLGEEAHRIRDAQHDHLPVLERDEAVVQVGG